MKQFESTRKKYILIEEKRTQIEEERKFIKKVYFDGKRKNFEEWKTFSKYETCGVNIWA